MNYLCLVETSEANSEHQENKTRIIPCLICLCHKTDRAAYRGSMTSAVRY